MSDYLTSMLASGVTSLFDAATGNIGTALTGNMSAGPQLAASAMSRGASAAQAQNYDLAIQEFKRAAAYNPSDPTAYSYMGQVYMMQNKYSDAIGAYKKGLEVDSQNDPIRLNLAKAYLQSGDTNNAEKQYLQLAKTNPTSPEPPTTLGYMYLQSGRLAEADTQFTKVIRMAPQSATAYYNLGLVRNKQGNYQDAVGLFQQAITLDPKNENVHADLAYAYIGLGDTASAKQQYNQLVAMNTTTANALANQVYTAINTPQIFYNDVTKSDFNTLLGPQTPVASLDPSLATPGASKVFKMTFVFNQAMDLGSVMNLSNWSITKADGSQNGAGGTYNDGAYVNSSQQAYIPYAPLSITYDSTTNSATVYFRVTQNASGDALIDPKHWVFAFNGKDATGRTMDPHGNEYDGYSLSPF